MRLLSIMISIWCKSVIYREKPKHSVSKSVKKPSKNVRIFALKIIYGAILSILLHKTSEVRQSKHHFLSFVIIGLFEWLNFLSLTLINCLITVQAFVPLFAKEKRFCELRGRADIWVQRHPCESPASKGQFTRDVMNLQGQDKRQIFNAIVWENASFL